MSKISHLPLSYSFKNHIWKNNCLDKLHTVLRITCSVFRDTLHAFSAWQQDPQHPWPCACALVIFAYQLSWNLYAIIVLLPGFRGRSACDLSVIVSVEVSTHLVRTQTTFTHAGELAYLAGLGQKAGYTGIGYTGIGCPGLCHPGPTHC